MKKQFEEPVVELIPIDLEDVICTSDGGIKTESYIPGELSWEN